MRLATILVLGCGLHLLVSSPASALTPKDEREHFQQVGRIEGRIEGIDSRLSRTGILVEDISKVVHETNGKLSLILLFLGAVGATIVSASVWFYKKLVFLEHRIHADLTLVSPASAKPKKGH